MEKPIHFFQKNATTFLIVFTFMFYFNHLVNKKICSLRSELKKEIEVLEEVTSHHAPLMRQIEDRLEETFRAKELKPSDQEKS